jgi:hypothetical protein
MTLLVDNWNEQEVCIWLDRIGFSSYKDNFLQNHVTGKNLFDLTEKDLTDDFNIKDESKRKVFLNDLQFLKKLYPKNNIESKYIRKKLLKFYEKNKSSFDNLSA